MLRKVVPLALIGAIAIFFAACTTTNPYTGKKHMSNTGKGSLIGAGAGAALGALVDSSNRAKGALIGAGVGALAGAGVGYYMDRQTDELRKQLEGTGVHVTRQGNDITLVMPGNVTFAPNSTDIKPQFDDVLDSVAKVVNRYDKTVLLCAGYTDNTGTAKHNMQLSKERAQSVARYLVEQGVKPRRLVTQGFGEAHPLTSNATAKGRILNRRVELTLEPLTPPAH
jgi:outer membrane protein OmpA-like peptidoglycan-associated protein